MRKWFLILALCLVSAGCGARPRDHQHPAKVDGPSFDDRTISVQTEPTPIARQMEGQQGVVQLLLTDGGITPAVIPASLGARVRIHVQNRGSLPHNFIIPQFGIVGRVLEPGGENYIEFTPNQKGQWPYFSDAPGQEEPGLKGVLQVE